MYQLRVFISVFWYSAGSPAYFTSDSKLYKYYVYTKGPKFIYLSTKYTYTIEKELIVEVDEDNPLNCSRSLFLITLQEILKEYILSA